MAASTPSDTLDIKFERMTPSQVRKWLAYIVVIGGVATFAVFFAYFNKFALNGGVYRLSDDHEEWARFGEYVGGTAGPILGFLTMLGLVLTLVLQVRQLEDSREQLKASQAELERSREIQLTMANAMNEQARYATISARVAALHAALSVVTKIMRDLDDIVKSGEPSDVSHHAQYLAASRREAELSEEILKLTDQLRI